MQAPPAIFRQTRKLSDVCRSTLEMMQHNTVPCRACLPPAGSLRRPWSAVSIWGHIPLPPPLRRTP